MKKKDLLLNIAFFIMLFSFFRPEYLLRFPIFAMMLNGMKIFSLICIILVFFKERKISHPLLLMIIFWLWMITVTIYNNGDVSTVLNYGISVIALTYIMDYGINKYNRNFFSTLMFCFELVIYINLITIIAFPEGLYTTGSVMTGMATSNWFLGYDNTHIAYFLPAFIVAILYKNLYKKNLRANLLLGAILLSIFICQSGTSLVGGILMIAFIVFHKLIENSKIFNLKNYCIIIVMLFFLIVVFRVQNLFSFIIVGILHKDLTFTNRTMLWDITLSSFLQHPFIGYGWQSQMVRHSMYNSQTIIFAHNQILEYLYLGGIVNIIFYGMIIWYSYVKNKENSTNSLYKVISYGFLILQILYITEVYLNPIIYIVIILLLYANCICNINMKGANNDKIINNYSSI